MTLGQQGGTMARRTGNNRRLQKSNGANLGFEEKMWQAADKLRGHMDAAEYTSEAEGIVEYEVNSQSRPE